MSKYDDLNKLEDLKLKGGITEEEYQKEKEKILNGSSSNLWGMNLDSFLLLMHLSQFAGFIVPGLGFVLPIVMWQTNKEDSEVDKHGKNIANFMLSMIIYFCISGILCLLLVGFVLLGVLAILEIVFIIMAAVKASRREYWEYPLSIKFFS